MTHQSRKRRKSKFINRLRTDNWVRPSTWGVSRKERLRRLHPPKPLPAYNA